MSDRKHICGNEQVQFERAEARIKELAIENKRLQEENFRWQSAHTALKWDYQNVEAERDQLRAEVDALHFASAALAEGGDHE